MTKEEQKLIAIFRESLTIARDAHKELRIVQLKRGKDPDAARYTHGVLDGLSLAVEMAERFEMKLADD